MEEEDIEEMADDNLKREKFVDDVKKSLVKTLKVCLTQKEVAKIQREFEKNVGYQEALANHSGHAAAADVPSLISSMVTNQVDRDRPSLGPPLESPSPSDESSFIRTADNFVKPEFMRVNKENPFPFPAPEKKRPSQVTKELKVFEQTFTRTNQMEKVQRNLERQKRRAERSVDRNKKYPGFGEVYDPKTEKMKKRAEKKLAKEIRRMNRVGILKKANVSKAEKDLMNELILVAEKNVSISAASSAPDDSEFHDSKAQKAPTSEPENDETKHHDLFLQQNDVSFDVNDLLSSTVKSQIDPPVAEKYDDYHHKMDTINEFELQRDVISSQDFIDDLDTLLEM